MPREEAVMIDGRLEAGVTNLSAEGSKWCAVLTHPHPKLGGHLSNNVVASLREELNRIGVSTVRFNTRGVGRSKGWSTWRGVDERQDVVAAVEYAKGLPGVDKVALVAYSFGSAVGMSVSAQLAAQDKLHGVVVFGYPKGFWAGFLFSPHYGMVDPQSNIPKLFILGDQDNFTSVSTMQNLMEHITEPKQLIILDGLDHFGFGEEHRIGSQVVKFFNESLL